MKKELLLFLFFLIPASSFAQQNYIGSGKYINQLDSYNYSGSIQSTGIFQQIQPITLMRGGCIIQNKGLNNMWVYFGMIGNATTSGAALLPPNYWINCTINNNYVLRDQISITGTAGDTFFANFQ